MLWPLMARVQNVQNIFFEFWVLMKEKQELNIPYLEITFLRIRFIATSGQTLWTDVDQG